MGTDVEVARPGSNGADVTHRTHPAGLQRALQLPQQPLPRRDPGRIRLHRGRRWTVLAGGAVPVGDGPTGLA